MEGTKFADKIKEVLTMAGPGFAVGSNVSLKLNFDDKEEVAKHPMAGHILITLDQIVQMVAGLDKAALLGWEPDFSSVDKEELDKHIEGSDYCKEKKKMLDFIHLNKEILADFDPNCKVEILTNIFEVGSKEITIQGHGYGELVSFIVQMLTLKTR